MFECDDCGFESFSRRPSLLVRDSCLKSFNLNKGLKANFGSVTSVLLQFIRNFCKLVSFFISVLPNNDSEQILPT